MLVIEFNNNHIANILIYYGVVLEGKIYMVA
jgi:hypothetical protein